MAANNDKQKLARKLRTAVITLSSNKLAEVVNKIFKGKKLPMVGQEFIIDFSDFSISLLKQLDT